MIRRERERGQVLVLAGLFLAVLLVSAGLAIDYSSWLVARRDFQSISDAAALAGSGQLPPPGTAPLTLQMQQNAAADSLFYLSEHLGWGWTRNQAQTLAENDLTVTGKVQRLAPLTVDAGSNRYCVWVWTPTPLGTELAGTDATCQPSASSVLYSPANYPGSTRKVFVRVESPRPAYFARIAGFTSQLVSAIGVAGTSHANYAVIALKPRLSAPDNFLGITINGGSTLSIPVGDIGGNYSASWSGIGSTVNFTSGMEQVLNVEEPGTVQGSGSVVNGTVTQLEDYPIQDPNYFSPPPAFCTGDPTSQPCIEANANSIAGAGILTGATGSWSIPPKTGGTTGNGVYPSCAHSSDLNNQVLDLSCLPSGPTYKIYPGMYQAVIVPSGSTVTMSHYCYGDPADPSRDPLASPDWDCINNNRAGVYYFRSGSPNSGLILKSGSNAGSVTGCGILQIFDPSGPQGNQVQLNISGAGWNYNLNPSSCDMRYDGGNGPSGTTPYVWYGNNQPFTNPVSIWVRPTLQGYDVTQPQSGSSVIVMSSGSSIRENGVIYAPQDNTVIAGGPGGSGVGQIVSWTITYVGGSSVTEAYQGPPILRTRLYQ